MGIDGINKGGGPSGVIPASSGSINEVSGPQEFSVGKVDDVSGASAAGPLDRLRAGEIDLDRYLDIRVEQATAHLAARLDPEQLSFIRSSLREQMRQDPGLVDLVRRATGTVSKNLDRG